MDRRDFLKTAGVIVGAGTLAGASVPRVYAAKQVRVNNWPVLKSYDAEHLENIALPLGGIGTGTISLGGRGDLRDWEIMSRPAKGFVPVTKFNTGPFFILYAKGGGKSPFVRLLEGPISQSEYEGSRGSVVANHGFPRFNNCQFQAAYPLGQVVLSDSDSPVDVRLQAFNPLVPGDVDASSIPTAVLRYVLTNKTAQQLEVSVCGSVPNYISTGMKNNKNINPYRKSKDVQGLFMTTEDENKSVETWGNMALATAAGADVTYRSSWIGDK